MYHSVFSYSPNDGLSLLFLFLCVHVIHVFLGLSPLPFDSLEYMSCRGLLASKGLPSLWLWELIPSYLDILCIDSNIMMSFWSSWSIKNSNWTINSPEWLNSFIAPPAVGDHVYSPSALPVTTIWYIFSLTIYMYNIIYIP